MSDGSQITIRLSDGIKPNSWSAGVLEANCAEKCISAQLLSPPNGIIGKATLTIDTVITGQATGSNGSVSARGSRSASSRGGGGEDVEVRHEENEQEEEEEDDTERISQGEDEDAEDERQASQEHLIVRYVHHQHVYFLFNPWNKGEQ